MPSQLGLPSAAGRRGHRLGKAAASVLPAAVAGSDALMAVQAATDEASAEQPGPVHLAGAPPSAAAKRELPSRSARDKRRGPDPLAMGSVEYNRAVAALRSARDAALDRSQTAGSAGPGAAATRPAEPLAGRAAPAHPDVLPTDQMPASDSALQPEARAQQKRAALARTKRGRKRRQDGGAPIDCAERDAAAAPGSMAEPHAEAGATDASGAAGLVAAPRVAQGRRHQSPRSITELAVSSCLDKTKCVQQGQAGRGRAGASRSQGQAATQSADAGVGTSKEQPVHVRAPAAPVPSVLLGSRCCDSRSARGHREDQPRADQKCKRRRDDEPTVKSTKRRRVPKASTLAAEASTPMHHAVIAQPAMGAQLTGIDSVKLRQRSAPERLQALHSRAYNVLLAEQRQEAPVKRQDAPVPAVPPRQPQAVRQRRRSQSAPQPAAVEDGKPGQQNKLRKQQASSELQPEADDAAAQRGAASGQAPVVVLQRRTAHEAGTRTAEPGASRHPVARDTTLSKRTQPQAPLKRGKQRTRGAGTPGSTQQWVHLKPRHGE